MIEIKQLICIGLIAIILASFIIFLFMIPATPLKHENLSAYVICPGETYIQTYGNGNGLFREIKIICKSNNMSIQSVRLNNGN